MNSSQQYERRPVRGIRSPGGLAWLGVFLLGTLLWVVSFEISGAGRACRAMLANFNYFAPLAAGLTVWTAVVMSSRGSWPGDTENLAARGLAFSVPSVLILGLLWILAPSWSPWMGRKLEPAFFYETNFVLGRCMAGLVIFWVVAWIYVLRRRKHGGGVLGPVFIVVYALCFSLLGFDLGMAQNPEWYSTLFGGYFFISGLYIAVAAWGLTVCLLDAGDTKRRHDLGNLTYAFGLLTAYLFFAQTLPIWYENLPKENAFFVTRSNFQPWLAISYVIIASVLAGQLLYLLPKFVKRSRVLLACACMVVLIGMWLERWWEVAPSLSRSAAFGLPEISALMLCLGLFGMGFAIFEPGMKQAVFSRGDVP